MSRRPSRRHTTAPIGSRRRRALLAGLAVVAGLATIVAGAGPAAAETRVPLGAADSYGVLGGTTVTNTGPTVVSADLGVSPGAAVTGFPPGQVNNGAIHAADAHAAAGQAAMVTAYNDAAGRATTGAIVADLGGQVLGTGVYTGGAIELTGALTLDADGDPNAAFIFQAASTLVTAPSSSIVFIDGAQACNVFWQVGSSATIGTNTAFAGTVVALTAVSAQTGATVNGRLLARNAAVTLDSNVITPSQCQGAAPPGGGGGPTTTTSSTTTSTTTAPTTTTTSATLATTTTTSPEATTASIAPTTTTTVVGGAVVVTTTTVPLGSTVMLPRTGSALGTITIAGLTAALMGVGLIVASKRKHGGALTD